MNLIESLFFIITCIIGVIISKSLPNHLGSIAWLIGLPTAVIITLLVTEGLRRSIELWQKTHPLRPICKRGKCHSDDYEYEKTTQQGVIFTCKCGDSYLKIKNEFLHLPNEK